MVTWRIPTGVEPELIRLVAIQSLQHPLSCKCSTQIQQHLFSFLSFSSLLYLFSPFASRLAFVLPPYCPKTSNGCRPSSPCLTNPFFQQTNGGRRIEALRYSQRPWEGKLCDRLQRLQRSASPSHAPSLTFLFIILTTSALLRYCRKRVMKWQSRPSVVAVFLPNSSRISRAKSTSSSRCPIGTSPN